MGARQAGHRWAGFDMLSLLSLTAFFASMPFLLAPLNLLRPLLFQATAEPLLEPLSATPFLAAMALAAMFASLAMLFVCLLKTAYARLGRRLLIAAGGAYLVGMAFTCLARFAPGVPSSLLVVAGAFVGAGGAVLCMAWARRVHLPDLRASLASLVALGAALFVLDALISLAGDAVRAIALLALAAAGTAGCLRGALARRAAPRAARPHRGRTGGMCSGSSTYRFWGRVEAISNRPGPGRFFSSSRQPWCFSCSFQA